MPASSHVCQPDDIYRVKTFTDYKVLAPLMGPDTGRVSVPSWKLELIKNRRNSRTSASFSHYDRSRRPEPLKSPASVESTAKPRDIINFFNRNTSIDGGHRIGPGWTTPDRSGEKVRSTSHQTGLLRR